MAMMQQQRESRHLWVGNLPDHFDEDDIRAYFEKKFGEVEKVKLLPKKTGQGGGVAAFIDFIDLRSAQKAHNCPIVIQNREIRMNYNDPKQGRQPVNNATVQNFQRDFDRMPDYDEMPRMKDRQMKNVYRAPQRGFAPEYPDFEPDLDYRPPRQRSPPPPGPGYVKKQSKRQYSSSPDSNSGGYMVHPNPRQFQAVKEKKQRLVAAGEPIMGSSSGASRRMKVAKHGHAHGSGVGVANTSGGAGGSGQYIKMSKKMKHRAPSSSSSEAGRVSESESSDEAESSDARLDSDESISSEKLRGFHAIVVRNLPKRHKDQTIKEGLFFEFKKIGKAACIKLEGSGRQRIAFCYFRSAEECKRIVKEKDQKTFYGKAMEIDPIAQVRQERESQRDRMGVGQYGGMPQPGGGRYDNPQQMPPMGGGVGGPGDAQMAPSVNEFDPKSSRTLFIGNVPREIEETDLYKIFRKYGKILDIDVKRMQYGEVTYAFVQYAHIITCVEAINAEDGRKVGPYRCKTNFAKTTPSACLWASGLPEDVNKINLKRHFSRPHPVTYFIFDQKLGEALLYYSDVNSASEVLATVKTKKIENGRPYVDFSSREHQEYIMKCMKNKGDGGTRYSCSPSPNRGRGYSSSPLRRDNRRRSPSDSPPRGGSGGGRGSPGGAGGGPGRFSPSRRHGSHSSNRSSRSPSNGAGNVGGRENASLTKSSKGSNRGWKPSRSRSPSKGSGAVKYKRRPDSHGRSESKAESSISNSKNVKGQSSSSLSKKVSERSCVSSEDEHERVPVAASSKPPPEIVEPSTEVILKSENIKQQENETKSGEDLSELQQERERIRQQLMEEDKKSSEPEEGEFRAVVAAVGTATSHHETAADSDSMKTAPAAVKAEPYEECDIMMSDQSDLESEREKSSKGSLLSSGKEKDQQYSKNCERYWGDVDRGGGGDLVDKDGGVTVVKQLQKKTDDILSQQQIYDKKLKGMKDLASITGHFLEFNGGDVGEDRPHFQQVTAATALLQNYSPILNVPSGNNAIKGVATATSFLCKASNMDELSCTLIEKTNKDDDYICDSPGKQLDNFLSQARAKASEDGGRENISKNTETVSQLISSAHKSGDSRRREEQHETDDDDASDSDDAMRNKMSTMETELQLEDISSPEPFSDSEQQQPPPCGTDTKSQLNQSGMQTIEPRSPLASIKDAQIVSAQTTTSSKKAMSKVIKTKGPVTPPFPTVPHVPEISCEIKQVKTIVGDSAQPAVQYKSKKISEHLPAASQQKKSSLGYRVIPLDALNSSPLIDPRLNRSEHKSFSCTLRPLKYARLAPKSPRGENWQGFTESQLMLEDWKRRSWMKLKSHREEEAPNPPNLQRVNELLNKFNVTSIFDQDSQRLSVLDAEEEKMAKSSPTLPVNFESSPYSTEISPGGFINRLSIDIPSPSSYLRDVHNDISKKQQMKSPISVSSTSSLLKLEDPRLKGAKPAGTVTSTASTSAPPSTTGLSSSSDVTSCRFDSIRVSDKYQRKPASASVKTCTNSSSSKQILPSLNVPKEEPVDHVAGLLSPSTSSVSSNSSKLDTPAACRKQQSSEMISITTLTVSSPLDGKTNNQGKTRASASATHDCIKIEVDDIINTEVRTVFDGSEQTSERSIVKSSRITTAGCSLQIECDESIARASAPICSPIEVISPSIVKREPQQPPPNEDHSSCVHSSKQLNDSDTTSVERESLPEASQTNTCNESFLVSEEQTSQVPISVAVAQLSSCDGDANLNAEQKDTTGKEKDKDLSDVLHDKCLKDIANASKKDDTSIKVENDETADASNEKKNQLSVIQENASIVGEEAVYPQLDTPLCDEIATERKEAPKDKSALEKQVKDVEIAHSSKPPVCQTVPPVKKVGSSPKEKCSEIDIFSKSSGVKRSDKHSKNRHKKLERSGLNTSQVPSSYFVTSDKSNHSETDSLTTSKHALIDRGDESSENEAEKKTLDQLMGKSSAKHGKPCSSPSHTDPPVKTSIALTQSNDKKRVLDSLGNIAGKIDQSNSDDPLTQPNKKSKKKRDSLTKSKKSIEAERKHSNGQTTKCEEKENPKHFQEALKESQEPAVAVLELSEDEQHEYAKKAKITIETKSVDLKTETSVIVSQQMMVPLKLEIDSPPKLTSVSSYSDFSNTAAEESVSPSDKCKSAPVSSDSGSIATIQQRKKRPYVEIVVDESEDQENIDYVQNLHSSRDGIEICIKKVKTELLPVAANERDETSPCVVNSQLSRKPKVSPRKTSLSSSENRRKDDECKSPSRKHSRGSKSTGAKFVSSAGETAAELELSDLSVTFPSETESSQDGSTVSLDEEPVPAPSDREMEEPDSIVSSPSTSSHSCKKSPRCSVERYRRTSEGKESISDGVSDLLKDKSFFASFTDETDCEDNDSCSEVGNKVIGSEVSALKCEQMDCEDIVQKTDTQVSGKETLSVSSVSENVAEDGHQEKDTETRVEKHLDLKQEFNIAEDVVDIEQSGGSVAPLKIASPVRSKTESACKIAESILGAIETKVEAQQTTSQNYNESLYSLEATTNDISKSFAEMPVGDQKMYEYLAGLSTTSTFTTTAPLVPAPEISDDTVIKEDENTKLLTPETEVEETRSKKPDIDYDADLRIDETCESGKVISTNPFEPEVGKRNDADRLEYCTEEETVQRTPTKGRRRGGRYRRGRMSRPYNRKNPSNRQTNKQEVAAVPELSVDPAVTSQVEEVVSPPNMAVCGKEDARIAQPHSKPTFEETRVVVRKESMASVSDASISDLKNETSYSDAEPLQRRFSDISWSGNSGPTSPVSATMPPKERLKKQLKAFFAEQTNASGVTVDSTTCRSAALAPNIALPFNRTNSAGSLESGEPTPPVPMQPEKVALSTAATYQLHHNPNPRNVSAGVEPQSSSPTIFTFNEFPPPNMPPFPLSRHQALTSPAPQQLRASPASSLMSIKSEPKQHSPLTARMQELKERTQELSLEREKRRSELKQLTSLSDAEIDNVEACIESVLQDNSILVKRFRCTADIEANFIDDEVRESAELLQSYVEDVRNFRYFGKQRKKNATEISNFSSSAATSVPNVASTPHAYSTTSRSPNPSTSPVSMMSRVAPAAPAHFTSDYPPNSIQSSIDRVILQHSIAEPKKTGSVNLEELQKAAVLSQHLNKKYSLNSSGDDMLQDLNLVSRTGKIVASSAENPSPSSHSLYSTPKTLLGLPLPFESTNSILQNPQNTAALAAAAAAAAASSNPLLQANDAFRLDHSNPQLLASPGSGATVATSSSAAPTAVQSTPAGGGGDMHININLLAHYPAYHPELLSTLYGSGTQATPHRLVTLQIPSPLDTTGIEAQMFIARTSNLYTMFNKLAHIWEGVVELKNSQARMSLRFIRGNMNLAMRALDSTLLNINQRMTLEETELEGLSHNLQNENDYCVMLGLPNGPDPTQICTSNRVLETEIAKYLREKDAAGIINLNHIYMERETQSVLHIFPPCEFTKKFLLKLDLYYRLNSANCSYLMFILTSAEVAATSHS